jgi:CBS-domain-containing membrane protein
MTTDLVTCRIDDELSVAEARIIESRKWRLVVVNEQGQLMGILKLVDLTHAGGPFKSGLLLRHLVDGTTASRSRDSR